MQKYDEIKTVSFSKISLLLKRKENSDDLPQLTSLKYKQTSFYARLKFAYICLEMNKISIKLYIEIMRILTHILLVLPSSKLKKF